MSFEAKYTGVCCQCAEGIEIGQLCQYWDDQEVGHVKCPIDQVEERLGRHERTCGQCFAIHAGECV